MLSYALFDMCFLETVYLNPFSYNTPCEPYCCIKVLWHKSFEICMTKLLSVID